jgi:hypothetical protein
LRILAWTPHLKICPRDGSAGDEYRIRGGRVEARALDCNGEPYPGFSEWVSLTPDEIRIHFVRQTAVARWLRDVLGHDRAPQEKQVV